MLSPFPVEYQIRQARVSDASELARLRWDFSDQTGQSFEAFVQDFDRFVRHALDGGAWTIWVAEQAERIIANMYLRLIEKVPRPGHPQASWGYLTNVYVEPFARNHGIGSHLLRTMQHWAQRHQVEFFLVWPAEESVQFYRRNGFVPNQEAFECDLGALAGEG